MKTIEEWFRRLNNRSADNEKTISQSSENEAKRFVPSHNASDTELEIEKAFAEYLKANFEVSDAALTAVAGGYDTASEEQGYARDVANRTDAVFRFHIGERVEVGRLLLLSRSGVITKRYTAKQEGVGKSKARYTIRLESGEEVEKDEGDIYY